MSSKLVCKFECQRCTRVFYEDYDEGKPVPTAYSVKVELTDMNLTDAEPVSDKLEFDTLCVTCFKTVTKHVAAIGKKMSGKSPDRRSRAKKEEPEGSS